MSSDCLDRPRRRAVRRATVVCVVLGVVSLAAAYVDRMGVVVLSGPPPACGGDQLGGWPPPLPLDVAAAWCSGLAGLAAVLGPIAAPRTRGGFRMRCVVSVFAAFSIAVSCFAVWNERVTPGPVGTVPRAAAPYSASTPGAVPVMGAEC